MRKALVIAAVAFAGLVAEMPAKASTFDPNCVVSQVQFANDTWGRAFFFQCTSGATYYVYLSGGGSGCTNGLIDDIKLYEPIVLASKLAGKSVQVSYNTSTCSSHSVRNVVGVGIQN